MAEFYQSTWPLIKEYFIDMIQSSFIPLLPIPKKYGTIHRATKRVNERAELTLCSNSTRIAQSLFELNSRSTSFERVC